MGELQLLSPLHRELERSLATFEAAPDAPGFFIPPKVLTIEEFVRPLKESCPDAWDLSWEAPWDLPGGDLLDLSWESTFMAGGSTQRYVACQLPGGERVYACFTDWGPSGFVAATHAIDSIASDRRFLSHLLRSNGRAFGLGVMDGAPTSVCTSDVYPRSAWVELLKELFESSQGEFGQEVESFYSLFRYEEYEEAVVEPLPGQPPRDPDSDWDGEVNWDAVFSWWIGQVLPAPAEPLAQGQGG